MLNSPPKIFNSGIRFSNCFFELFYRYIIRAFAAFFSYLLGYKFDIVLSEQLQTFGNYSVLDFLLADNRFITVFLSGFLEDIIVILLAGFACTAVTYDIFVWYLIRRLC